MASNNYKFFNTVSFLSKNCTSQGSGKGEKNDDDQTKAAQGVCMTMQAQGVHIIVDTKDTSEEVDKSWEGG